MWQAVYQTVNFKKKKENYFFHKKIYISFHVSSTVDSLHTKFTTEALGTTPVECINILSIHSTEKENFSLPRSKKRKLKKFFFFYFLKKNRQAMRMAIECSVKKNPVSPGTYQTMRMAIDCILVYLKISVKNLLQSMGIAHF